MEEIKQIKQTRNSRIKEKVKKRNINILGYKWKTDSNGKTVITKFPRHKFDHIEKKKK